MLWPRLTALFAALILACVGMVTPALGVNDLVVTASPSTLPGVGNPTTVVTAEAPVIIAPGPSLQIRTRASRPVLRAGQRTTITLRVGNPGGSTAKSTVTRAAIPRGFTVANPMGGTVRNGFIYFRTGHIKAAGSVVRRFVLVATSRAAGTSQSLMGRSRATNTGSVTDPTALRVLAPATPPRAPVTG